MLVRRRVFCSLISISVVLLVVNVDELIDRVNLNFEESLTTEV